MWFTVIVKTPLCMLQCIFNRYSYIHLYTINVLLHRCMYLAISLWRISSGRRYSIRLIRFENPLTGFGSCHFIVVGSGSLRIRISSQMMMANTGHEITYKRYIFAKYYNNSQNQQTSDNEPTNRYQANWFAKAHEYSVIRSPHSHFNHYLSYNN